MMGKNQMKIRMAGVLCTCLFAPFLSAQQTFQGYNLLDEEEKLFASGNTETLNLLNDKNDATVYSVPFSNPSWVMYKIETPFVVTANLLIASDDKSAAPKTFRVEGSNDGETWTRIVSELGASLSPREAFLSKSNNTNAYTYFRLNITGTAGGANLEIAEWQLLGYPETERKDLTEQTRALTGQYADNASLKNLMDSKPSAVYSQSNVKSCWVEYELDEPQKIEGYSLMSTGAGNAASNPKSWELSGSNDRENWEILDSRSNVNLLNVSNNMQVYWLARDKRVYEWGEYAEQAQQSMLDHFWATYGTGHYLIHGWHPNSTLSNTGFNYWWMAHVIDVCVDAYQRSGDAKYRKQAIEVYNAMISYGKKTYGHDNSLWNGFFDDMEWMGLACLRADAVWGSALEKRWSNGAVQLWEWIKAGWNEQYYDGGIQWNDQSPSSKNACSNAPAAILAARLYSETGNQEYLEWAVKIWDWMNSHLLFDNGIVKDSYTQDNWGWTFTYNQGTWIGACLELYKITGEQKYRDAAVRNADYVVNDWEKFSPHGILDDGEGKGDGGLFKGIFMRYLSQWILSGKLDPVRQQHYAQYMLENGKSLWDAATLKPEIIFKNNWRERPERVLASSTDKDKCYDASMHLSGVMVFELLDELARNGKLPEGNQNPESVANKNNAYKYYRLTLKSNAGGNGLELSRWQLLAEIPSGMMKPADRDRTYSLFTKDSALVIENKGSVPLAVKVYSTGGILLKSVGRIANSETFSLPAGVYLVNICCGQVTFREKVWIM
ncbi:glycoside hydrolase family 76 protein [Bacteroides sp.]